MIERKAAPEDPPNPKCGAGTPPIELAKLGKCAQDALMAGKSSSTHKLSCQTRHTRMLYPFQAARAR
jgi:hypothetical protein